LLRVRLAGISLGESRSHQQSGGCTFFAVAKTLKQIGESLNFLFLISFSTRPFLNLRMLTTELIKSSDPANKKIMVVLHGLGDSMDGYRWLPDALKFPWLNYLLVNAPDPYYGGFSWYDIAGEAGTGVERSRKALHKLIDDLQIQGYRTEEMVLFGFSQGCLMTVETGLTYPAVFAGLIGISGYVHDLYGLLKNLSPFAREQRLLITHGTFDQLIPFEKAQEQFQQLKSSGLNLEWVPFKKEHTIAGLEEIQVIQKFIRSVFDQKAAS